MAVNISLMSVAHHLHGSDVVARSGPLRRARRKGLDALQRAIAERHRATALADDLRLFAMNFAAGFVFLTVYLA